HVSLHVCFFSQDHPSHRDLLPFPTRRSSDLNEIIQYANKLGYPLVIKRADGSFGRGVITNILSVEEFKDSLKRVRHEMGYDETMVEQYIRGKEYRVYVSGDEAVAAMNRTPPNISGDGVHTIRQLIDEKNKAKRQNPRLISCLIDIKDDILDSIHFRGYELESILEKDKQLFLSEISNISIGGDPISVTDQLPDSVKELAVSALHAVPGLEHG